MSPFFGIPLNVLGRCGAIAALATVVLQTEEARPADTETEADASISVELLANERAEDLARFKKHGVEAEEEGRFFYAEFCFRQALVLAPNDPAATAGLKRIMNVIGNVEADGASGADRYAARIQLADTEISVALTRARRQALAEKFEDARESATMARELIRQYGRYDALAQVHEVGKLIDSLHEQTALENTESDKAKRARALLMSEDASRRLAQEERTSYEQRVLRIVKQKQLGHYELALALSRSLVSDRPGEEPGEALYAELIDLVHLQRKQDHQEKHEWMYKELYERIHRAMVPANFDGSPVFPETWFEVQDKRQAAHLYGEVDEAPWKSQILNKLALRIDVNFEDTQIAEALDAVAQLGGLNLVVGPDVRALDGVPVSLLARGMSVRNVIDWICRQADVTWDLRNEAIWVGDDTEEEAITQVYDITQLVRAPKDLPGVNVAAFSLNNDGGNFNFLNEPENNEALAPEDLVDLLQQAVAPEVWDNPDYQVTVRDSRLFIRAPQDVHDLTHEFMTSQLRANNQQVFFRLTWLLIRDGFLEEIGVDWSNSGRSDVLIGPRLGGIERTNQEWSFFANAVNDIPARAIQLGSGLTGPSALSGGLTLQWLRLLGPELSVILRAQQRKVKVRRVDELELCTLNAVRGNVFLGRVLPYVAGVDFGGGEDGAFDLEIDTITTGLSLDLKPFISADKKYITVDIRPLRVTVEFAQERFEATRAIGVEADGIDTGILVSNSVNLELPTVTMESAGTRVMIPDKGSVLVGGLGNHIEQSGSSKVPVLGHIPFLGRLFGVRDRVSENSQMYLRVYARMILYDEEEANL